MDEECIPVSILKLLLSLLKSYGTCECEPHCVSEPADLGLISILVH